MAHLFIGKVSFNRLVNMLKGYKRELNSSTDIFEKDEISSFIDTIRDHCIMRGGYDYWYKVLEASEK